MSTIRSTPVTVSVTSDPSTGLVGALDVLAEDPTDPTKTLGIGPLRSAKHLAMIENETIDADRKVLLFSGDWDDGWPLEQRADYPPNPYWSSSGRQEMWFADVSNAALDSGTLRFALAQNFYHNYPWDGAGGHFGPGRPGGGTEPERGPYMPDALGFVVDKRGDFWMGPCTVGYDQVEGEAAGESFQYWAPMYKWKLPGLAPNGVRLGNGWTRPPQNRLKSPGTGGQPGSDFDVGIYSDSEFLGVGRPNTAAYDPVSDSIYVVGVGGSDEQLFVSLFRFPCVPEGGEHLWTREELAPLSLAGLGLPNATSGPLGYGDVGGSGCIGNTVVCNGKLYFTFVTSYTVAEGAGNASSTMRRISWILGVDLQTKAVEWVPYPRAMNWWLRPWDGPEAADGFAPGTPAQYRALKAVRKKLVMCPEAWHNVTKDPWVSVYDTTTKVWTNFDPPASHAITNGGHDYPQTLFGAIAMPSLGEVWLAGKATSTDYQAGDAYQQWLIAKGLYRGDAYQVDTGIWVGRRVIRLQVA